MRMIWIFGNLLKNSIVAPPSPPTSTDDRRCLVVFPPIVVIDQRYTRKTFESYHDLVGAVTGECGAGDFRPPVSLTAPYDVDASFIFVVGLGQGNN